MNSDQIKSKIQLLLKNIKSIEKSAEDLKPIIESLLQVSDQLDQIGLIKASSYIDNALQRLTNNVALDNIDITSFEDIDPKIIIKAATMTLINLADKFDFIGDKVISSNLDMALSFLANYK